MSGHKSSKREREGDHRGGRDRDREQRPRSGSHARHGSRNGRDGSLERGAAAGRDSRDSRSRDHRGDGRGGSTTTPTKPPAGRGPVRGPVLGGSVFAAAAAEAAKRKAAEAAAAAAAAAAGDGGGDGDEDDEREEGEAEPGEVQPAARKKPRHEPIVWHSPSRDGDSSRPASQQETLQERLQREAAEFRQQQHQHAGPARPGSRGRQRSASRSRSASPTAAGAAAAQRQRGRSPSSSRSRSRSSSGGRRGAGRWQQQQEDDADGGGQQQQPRSRWFADEDDAAAAAAAAGQGEGEAPGAAVDEELEELNRRERAALAAGGDRDADLVGSDTPGASGAAGAGAAATPEWHKNMLEESRRVEEYERLNRISEGTYGVVYRARCKASGRIFALKKLKMEACPDGFPQTSVREINVLVSLHHPNIVNVEEVVVGSRDAIFMVMEYVEHDLKYIMELQAAKKAPPFSIGQVKCLTQQLLQGVAFLHRSWVIHRDLKTSNLLYSNSGLLKICDFGLARQYGDPLKPYTEQVVTLWYRSIERLLGDPLYSTALDMWSVGCIMAELILGEPLFQGQGEIDQIKKIFAMLGTPTQESWPGWDSLRAMKTLTFKPEAPKLRKRFTGSFIGSIPLLSDAGFDLLTRLLDMNPATRISAEEALAHRWFEESPRPVAQALMPAFTPRHQEGQGGGGGGGRG